MTTWLSVYQTAKEPELANALDVLEDRAKQLGHDDGLAFWESLLAKPPEQ